MTIALIFVCVPQDTGKDAYIKDLPNHLCKFEAVLAKSKSGFLVGDSVRHFYRTIIIPAHPQYFLVFSLLYT